MDASKTLILIGSSLVVIGVLVKYAPWLLSWFGKLPGDIAIERPNFRVFIPVSSMIIVSIILSLLRKLLGN